MLDETRRYTRGCARSRRPWLFSLFASVRCVSVLVCLVGLAGGVVLGVY